VKSLFLTYECWSRDQDRVAYGKVGANFLPRVLLCPVFGSFVSTCGEQKQKMHYSLSHCSTYSNSQKDGFSESKPKRFLPIDGGMVSVTVPVYFFHKITGLFRKILIPEHTTECLHLIDMTWNSGTFIFIKLLVI
jgi:hypothetical protein